MCEVGQRVATAVGSLRADGSPCPENLSGQVIGHMGMDWAVVVLEASGLTVLVPEGRARLLRQPGQRPGRSRPRRERVGAH